MKPVMDPIMRKIAKRAAESKVTEYILKSLELYDSIRGIILVISNAYLRMANN